MKDVELKLIVQLMMNSRRSDRQLAKAIGTSQPTVSRMLRKLEKEGYIKEYTIIPDFRKLGYQVMGITLLRHRKPVTKEKLTEIRKKTIEIEKQHPYASLLAVNVIGPEKERLFITFYQDYSDYSKTMQVTKNLPEVDVESLESFLVNLADESNYRLLSMSQIAKHLSRNREGTE
jgi:DNA-binding Lrp family transcriptional regulator